MNAPSSDSSLRLNKHIALTLGVSRREADSLIEKGLVTINGKEATLGARFGEGDQITVRGRSLKETPDFVYLALNKPVGYVSSRKQQGESPTIYSLLPKQYHVLKPVGRLDKDSSGLLLLSNDGDFTQAMTHPSYHKTKHYEVVLDKDLEPLHQQMIADYGVQLDDGTSQLHLTRLNDTDRKHWQVTMHEGRNRQIRRTFAALGYTVVGLHRTNFGNYSLENLKPGEFQLVSKQ